MSSFSTRCATAASLLALATLPTDRSVREQTLTHDDFTRGVGYLRRNVNGVVCHGVDWDGVPGIESVVRENGVRSAELFREFRAWRATHNSTSLMEHGNKACALMAKHFGPYDKATSNALRYKRELENKRDQLAADLEKEFPLSLRSAAREHIAPELAYATKAPLASLAPLTTHAVDLSSHFFATTSPLDQPSPALLLKNEAILSEFIQTNSNLPAHTSLEDAAKTILNRYAERDKQIDYLRLELLIYRLPPIPGERTPADIDLIEYGSLICRHRAVIVALLLADAGYAIELVEGSVTQQGHSGDHLFIYSEEAGILEPSAEGPDFWRSTMATKDDPSGFLVLVDSETKYKFGHRTPLSPR